MGSYLKGDYVYIQGQIEEVDAKDSNRYRVRTRFGKFYANENEDVMSMDPNLSYSVNDYANMLYFIAARMTSAERTQAFGVSDVGQIITDNSMSEIIEKYEMYLANNATTVNDMVIYIPESSREEQYTCCVVAVNRAEEAYNNTYTLYNADNNLFFTAKRSEITNTGNTADVALILDNLREKVRDAE